MSRTQHTQAYLEKWNTTALQTELQHAGLPTKAADASRRGLVKTWIATVECSVYVQVGYVYSEVEILRICYVGFGISRFGKSL